MKRTLFFLAAIAAYFVAVLLWVGGDRRVAKHAYDDFSISNSSEKGLSLASKYLARSGRRVGPLTLAVNDRNVERRAVVFRVGAPAFAYRLEEFEEEKSKKKKDKKPEPRTHYVKPLLTDEEDAWVRAGGRLVIATDERYGSLDVNRASNKAAKKVFPLWAGIDTLDLPESRVVGGDALRNGHTVYTADDKSVVARIADGAGDVIVFGVPEALDNEHLAKHLPFLVALTGGARRVYFDETIHGMATGEGMLALLKEWRLGPFLLLLLILTAAIFWRGGARIGIPDDEFRDTRSEAIDLVGSLGALYDRSMTKGEALAAYHRELTRAVAASTGLRGEALHKRVSEMAGGVGPTWKHQEITNEEFQRMLASLNAAFARL
ncbi:MAG TPA: hypothetical protein VJZ76_07060 [Thermoanaerobaculia bacterium]|nr:hypothetical protein [Thermoanaerobaculia bacterium]